MSTPENNWSVSATLSVTAADAAAAQTAAATALTDISAALVSLANGTEFSVPETVPGEQFSESGANTTTSGEVVAFDVPSGENGVYSVSGAQLLVPAPTSGEAQSLAEDAASAIADAISGLSGTSVTFQSEPGGAEGGFVFNLLQ